MLRNTTNKIKKLRMKEGRIEEQRRDTKKGRKE